MNTMMPHFLGGSARASRSPGSPILIPTNTLMALAGLSSLSAMARITWVKGDAR
jgi:tRNA A37 threonylcarbamoyladenosine synthetase subunit TsaC/SUA5/YrdC